MHITRNKNSQQTVVFEKSFLLIGKLTICCNTYHESNIWIKNVILSTKCLLQIIVTVHLLYGSACCINIQSAGILNVCRLYMLLYSKCCTCTEQNGIHVMDANLTFNDRSLSLCDVSTQPNVHAQTQRLSHFTSFPCTKKKKKGCPTEPLIFDSW